MYRSTFFARNTVQPLIFVCVTALAFHGAQARPQGYEGYQLVKVAVANEGELKTLVALDDASREFEIWSDGVGVGTLDVRVSPGQKRALDTAGLSYEVMVDDLQALYDELFGGPRGGDFFDVYRTYDEHVAFMNGLVTAHPGLATMVNLGESVLGRPLWAIRISGSDEEKPGVMYHGAQHGNEIMGACVVAYAAQHLLVNYDTDPVVAALVNNVEWYLLPIMNPDGYEYGSRANANGYDLNRNWGGPGSNSNPFSQPETAAMRDFFLAHPNVGAHIDFHSYGYMILWPWGYTDELCEDHWAFDEFASEMHDRILAVRGTDYDRRGPMYTTIYPVHGGSVDYSYGDLGLWAIVFELGYAFYMPVSEILPTSEEILSAMLLLPLWDNDCNGNGVPDNKDITGAVSDDHNANDIPDECEVRRFVDADAPSGGNGLTWSTAFGDLQEALAAAATTSWGMYSDIRVAEGVYRPAGPGGDRTATFLLEGWVGMRGGYAGIGAPDPNERDIVGHETILSGDLNGDGAPVPCTQDDADCWPFGRRCIDGFCIIEENNGENSYHVVTGHGSRTPVLLDGFTITAGNANSHAGFRGAGMVYDDSRGTIAHCTFRGNSARVGAGMYINGGSPLLMDCAFTENSSEYSGGGLYSSLGDLTLTRCTFIANTSSRRGGGIRSYGSDLTLTNNTLIGNTASLAGGGMYSIGGSSLLSNCTFAANSARDWQALVCNWASKQDPGSVAMTNCVLWDGGDEIGKNEASTVTIAFSVIQGGWPGEGNIDADPLFVDADGADDILGTEDDNLRLSPGSPCINTGDPAYVPKSGTADLDGHPRVLCGRLDMGSFEFGIGDFDCDQWVDLTDFAAWQACMTGPLGGPYDSGCEIFDFDYNGRVDTWDFGGFQRAWTGTGP